MPTVTEVPTCTEDLKGAIFVRSWGYDQTNINFYQVVKVTPKTVTLAPMLINRDTDGYLTPVSVWPEESSWLKGKRPKFTEHYGTPDVWIKINSYSAARLWNGKPMADTYTHGGCGH